jgi:TonB family protein
VNVAGLRVPIGTEETNVSEDPAHGASKIHASKPSDGGGGGAGKWLLGGLAAVVLLGGGYYAWKSMAPNQSNSELAYNDETYADDPLRAGPLDDDVTAESAMADDEPAAEPASSGTRRTAPAAQRSTASAEAVPEATIGVTPVSLSTDQTDEGEDIIVNAPRRPVWVQAPSERRLATLYPARALQQGLEGEASLQCTVLDGGSLDCAPVSESETGFGNAALRVSRQLRHASYTSSGADAAGTPVNLRVVFRMEDGARRG